MNLERLGEKMKRARKAKGLSTRALARAAGLAHSTIVRIEYSEAHPRIDTMEKICEALGIPMASLCIESLREALEAVYLDAPGKMLDSMEAAVLSVEREWNETHQ